MILNQLKESCHYIHKKTSLRPQLAITLGSGLSSLVSEMDIEISIPFSEIPHFPLPTVEGHTGSVVMGHIDGKPLIALQGRIHYYEGYSWQQVVYPTHFLGHFGVKTLILTNASGGMDPRMKPGHLMLIKDHINLTGHNPLIGPNCQELGPRFPDMSQPYDLKLISLAKKILETQSLPYSEGVYCGVLGPTYETASEIKFMQQIGGHAVGMSTVAETIAAVHMGIRVCGISCITNLATGLTHERLRHEDIKEVARSVEKNLGCFVKEFIGQIQF